jgi:hypothetical protein
MHTAMQTNLPIVSLLFGVRGLELEVLLCLLRPLQLALELLLELLARVMKVIKLVASVSQQVGDL